MACLNIAHFLLLLWQMSKKKEKETKKNAKN